MRIINVVFLTTLLFTGSADLFAQKIEVTSNPDEAFIIVKGTSEVTQTSDKIKPQAGVFLVYSDNHLPAYFEGEDFPEAMHVDLVPVRDVLGNATSPSLEFTKIVFSLLDKQEIGSIGLSERKMFYSVYVQRSLESNLERWHDLIQKELQDRGLSMASDVSDLFGEQAKNDDAKYLLGAEIKDIWISRIRRQAYAYMRVDWSLFDPDKREVVQTVTSYGFGRGPEGQREHLDGAVRTAALHLTCDETFIETLMK